MRIVQRAFFLGACCLGLHCARSRSLRNPAGAAFHRKAEASNHTSFPRTEKNEQSMRPLLEPWRRRWQMAAQQPPRVAPARVEDCEVVPRPRRDGMTPKIPMNEVRRPLSHP